MSFLLIVLIFDVSQTESPNAEYMLSGSEDNIVAYRILQLSDDSSKNNDQTIHATTATINNSVTTTVPQQLQYIVIDSSNGFLQAVPTTQITAAPSTPIKMEPQTTSHNSSSSSSSSKMRTSVAIAPKNDFVNVNIHHSSFNFFYWKKVFRSKI